jgi:isopentenyl phosphate kinase
VTTRPKSDHLDTARLVMPGQEESARRFAEAAAKSFTEHPEFHSFSDGEIDPLLLALRWGVSGQAVLVVQLDEGFQPVIYGDVVPKPGEAAP